MLLPESPQRLALRAQAVGATVEVVLCDPLGRDHTAHPDWRIAALLCDQQGGRLRQDQPASPGGETCIFVTLPGLEQQVVLVVDDNPALHQLFERYLATTRYAVIHAYSGSEALELAEAKRPDFITLDVMMAAMDGWQVLRSLQQNQRTATIPVVVCSVLREPQLALALGAKAYLKKPVERLQLQAVLDQLAAAPLSPLAGS
jgi:CheY-like chemotaxis protein